MNFSPAAIDFASAAQWLSTCIRRQGSLDPIAIFLNNTNEFSSFNEGESGTPYLTRVSQSKVYNNAFIDPSGWLLITQAFVGTHAAAKSMNAILDSLLDLEPPLPACTGPLGIVIVCLNPTRDPDVLHNMLQDAVALSHANPRRFLVKPHFIVGDGHFLSAVKESDALSDREQGVLSMLRQHNLRLQPQAMVPFDRTQPIGFELLARQALPNGQLVSAGEFLNGCNHSAVHRALDLAVLERLYRISASVLDNQISVNVDRSCLVDSEWLRRLDNLLHRRPKLRKSLTLEVTERGPAQKIPDLHQSLAILKRWGLTLMIDDFGTGITTLNELVTSPVESVKFDQSVVRAASTNETVASLLGCMISFAKRWQFDTVAEGVESADVLLHAEYLGFDRFQGYYFSDHDQEAI